MFMLEAPNWLSTMGGCIGISVTGTGISSFGKASAGIGGIVMAWVSVTVTGVAILVVTSVDGMPGTCLLHVLCLVPVRAQKPLVMMLWLFLACN